MDESRFGTHSKVGHGWFEKGSRTAVKVKLGFENFYVYGAVSPKDGESYSIVAPKVNSEWLNLFLEEMSKYLGSKQALIVMDQASWHRSKKRKVPQNVQIMYLPAYSPELNPVERLWQYMKRQILKNKIYERIEELERATCRFIRKWDKELIKSICALNYLNN